jgi:hypothetical protein
MRGVGRAAARGSCKWNLTVFAPLGRRLRRPFFFSARGALIIKDCDRGLGP